LILEDFFEMIKTTVIVGYGMTETSPVITNRYTRPPTCLLKEGGLTLSEDWCYYGRLAENNLAGSVGLPAKDTLLKILDPETGAVLGP
jgi:acyl-CoA synthetase (AMP-forming)/AMP-acid ligase II